MHNERHVFGSHKGYTTLAKSPGISAEDARQLEAGVYGFGQTEDRGYAKNLHTHAAWFTRVLRGGRRGLTRVFTGSPDIAGRATDLMITVVLANADWDGKLYGDISLLLHDDTIWKWSGGAQIDAIDCSFGSLSSKISQRSGRKVAALISEIERRWPVAAPIVVAAGDYEESEIRAVEMLMPPVNRPQFTSACRTLSPQLGVTLNQLAPEAPLQTTNFRYDAASPMSTYGHFLLANGLANGRFPTAEVMNYRQFGQAHRTATGVRKNYPPPPPMPREKARMDWIIISAAAVIITVLFAAIPMWGRKKVTPVTVAMPTTSASNDPVISRPSATTAPTNTLPNILLMPSELDHARSSMHDKSDPDQTSVAITPKTTPEPKEEPAVAQVSSESQQDRDLKQLEREWHGFFGVISRESLTFDQRQMRSLRRLETEMERKGLVHRVELESTNSVSMLPLLLDLHDQYVAVNSLLSNDALTNMSNLELKERQLEDSVKKIKAFLRSIITVSESDSHPEVIFSTIDAAITDAKMRLKESREERRGS